jgi:hypothetical protein
MATTCAAASVAMNDAATAATSGMYQSTLERAARWLAREFAVATTERPLQK